LKKILIITANYGAGHLIASIGLKQLLEDKNNEVIILDLVENGSFIEKITSKIYIWMNRNSHILWRMIYYNPLTKTKFIRKALKLLINKKIYKIIQDFKPEIIISTHFLSTIYGDIYKRKNNNVKLYVCITDFEIHPIWINENVDLYFLPSEFSLKTFKLKNYIITGIPLRKGFLNEFKKEDIKNELNIKTNKLIVLLNLGANSVLPLKDAIKYIKMFKENFYFLIIAGKDKKRYNEILNMLNKINNVEYKIFSFTDEIYKLMSISDFCITKAGGLSVSELIYTKTPAIYYKSLPGQEEGNEKFIKEYGLGFISKSFKQLIKFSKFILENPSILEYFKRNLNYQKQNMKFFEIKKAVSHETLAL